MRYITKQVLIILSIMSIMVGAQISSIDTVSLPGPYDRIKGVELGQYHPSVVYFEHGWSGHKYWMAWTPHSNLACAPGQGIELENPCIAFSEDGIRWDTTGIRNPIVDPPGCPGNYADTELFYSPKTDSLYLFFMDTRHGIFTGISCRASADGLHWGKPDPKYNRKIKSAATIDGDVWYTCPSVVVGKKGKWFDLYLRNWKNNHCSGLWKYRLNKKFEVKDSTFVFFFSDRKVDIWHYDIIQDDGRLLLIGNGAPNGAYFQKGCALWLGVQTGSGFMIQDEPLVPFDEISPWRWIYRPCGLIIDDTLRVWFNSRADYKGMAGRIWHFDYLLRLHYSLRWSIK